MKRLSRKVLILFAHPAYHRSRANRAMAEAVRDLEGVTFHDLYEAYPDMLIDVAFEQDQLRAHDAVIAQHPFYWYSAPALIKEWLDLVLTHGWAYGEQGHALDGKLWMNAISTGGRNDSYHAQGYNRFSVEELLRPFEATANLCRMRWQAPFVLHGSHQSDDAALTGAASRYRARILELRHE